MNGTGLERAQRYYWLEALTFALWLVHMACHLGTSKYSRDAHKDRVLQLHCMTHLRRGDVYGGMYLYVFMKYFVLI